MTLGSPWFHGLVVGFILISALLATVAWGIWWERKFAALLHQRMGPVVVGRWGLLQPLADAVKLILKEDITPRTVDRTLFNIAPPLTVMLALSGIAVVPLTSDLVVSNLNIGVLFILSMSSLMVIPVWMAGWASNNKYALLGGMRAVAQGIAYEIPLLLSALVPVVMAGSMSLMDIANAQAGYRWFIWWPPGPGAVAFVIFLLSALAEANRIPFDIPEAESELIAGVATEYTGMKFGMFYLAEYVHTFVASAVLSVLFLGAWEGPVVSGPHWLLFKTCVLFTSIVWIRWSLLRFRSDQLMALCWNRLLPASLVVLAVTAFWVFLFPGQV
jgi:NADH-quinone oxidoreductase subunit H